MIDVHADFGAERHLRLGVQDIVDAAAGDSPPAPNHVLQLLEFGRSWNAGPAPLLVHCWAGISRSTAAAFILACDKAGRGAEATLAKILRERAAHAAPNRLMVQIGDDLLGRNGKMVDAVDTIGRGSIAAEGQLFELPVFIP
jgi:predicted protein tyrosine phosphatase